ncbi:MAG: hypothetical protein PXZ08_04910 [Actinomycetota bacterium]|nr:hypothetical protein [Actinomycetota bacterium]
MTDSEPQFFNPVFVETLKAQFMYPLLASLFPGESTQLASKVATLRATNVEELIVSFVTPDKEDKNLH